MSLTGPNPGKRGDRLIRFCDMAFSFLMLGMLLPVLVLLGLLIRLDSPGPALFRQDRIGAGGRRFKMIKFRTMERRADRRLPAYRRDSRGRLEPVIKRKEDDRVTRLGSWLRRSSLDELPQLFNVLKGEMSLVGPRPPIVEEADGYNEQERRRLEGMPGLTGLAQIHGRSDLDFEKIVVLDLEYISHRSIGLYLKILILTLPALFTGKSAY